MDELYTKSYLFDTLFIINNELENLSTWSVYNKDLMLDEIADLKKKSDEVRQKLIDLDKKGELEK